ncbi:MAG TPA: MBL fold metallo-hydrolase [Terracidiphilus sp.]|nr:MBL fold metallo-hydrolase [Terracidiphilus sp.]
MRGRREFLASAAAVLAGAALPERLRAQDERGMLPGWEPGTLEIHHIDTGRGNATLIVGPDGTTLLIDAGEAHSPERLMSPARPDASRRAGQWVARYVQRQIERIGQSSLNILLLTHLHGDHVGEVVASSPKSQRGNYRLTGAADVAETIEIREWIDRGWPDYDYPAPPRDATSLNAIALARSLAERGTRVQQAKAGSASQLALRNHPALYPQFQARVLAVNGNVWTGEGETSKSCFPSIAGLDGEALPSENMCCIALRIGYGKFHYYAGGDLTCDTSYGRYPWHDFETPVAQIAGPVSVAVADHHGYFDACGPAMVRALQPRAWVIPTWHASHPAMSVLANLFSAELYAGERSVFAVNMTPEALMTTERFSSMLSSSDGHVVVRVPRDGNTFTVHVVNARDERGTVAATFGPFPS